MTAVAPPHRIGVTLTAVFYIIIRTLALLGGVQDIASVSTITIQIGVVLLVIGILFLASGLGR